MEDIFAIGDLHGEEQKFVKMLKKWNPDNERLVLLGDLVDRGQNSLAVIQLAMELEKKFGAIVIGGNHDDIFLDWLKHPDLTSQYYFSENIGGIPTIRSFFNGENVVSRLEPSLISKILQEKFPNEISFLQKRPNFFEQGVHVFVHAGVCLDYIDWRETSRDDCTWIRDEFHKEENKTGKVFVFGHTPTKSLNPDKSTDVWVSPCQTKIGIDGGAVFGGVLHGLHVKTDGTYQVDTVTSLGRTKSKELVLKGVSIT